MTDRRASAHDLSLGREASAAEGDLRLPTAPGVIRRFWARHPWWTDSLIAAIYLIPALAGSITLMVERSGAASGVIEPILALVSGAGVLFRRRTPLFALAVTIGCAALTIASDGGFLVVGILFALYA
ncbi:MAG: hypothetical protein ABI310_06785, partial [Microbacteriaceae bacterium]